jgi:RNA polymerase subunit RPABC4/transcription elongation factor Spt4
MINCPQCKINLPEGSQFCRACGHNLNETAAAGEDELRCKRCGAETQVGWKTCVGCGSSLEAAPATVKMMSVKMTAPRACSSCGAALGEGMKFCMACGATGAARSQATVPFSEKERGAELPPTLAELPPTLIERIPVLPEPLPSQAEIVCRKCAAIIQPDKKFCERCGAAVAVQQAQAAPNKSRKTLLAASGAALALILLTVAWHLWGVTLTVVTGQPGVQALIDDEPVGSLSDANGRIIISHALRGARTLRLKREGFEDAVISVKLGPGDFSKTVEVNLSPYRFSLMLATDPASCSALIDGKEAGSTDEAGKLTLKDIARGDHTLTIQHAGYQDWTQVISVTSSQTIRAELTLAVGGIWQGSFSTLQTAPSLGFILNLEQTGATFKGKAEQRDNGNSASDAVLEGSVKGREIKYVKRYPNGGESTYAGTIDASGKRASGTWLTNGISGTWMMAKAEQSDSRWIAPLYNKIDSFNAQVTDLKFYEAGSEEPPQRKYSAVFKSASTRSIYYELNLQYPKPGRRVEFETAAVYYNADGTILGEKTRQARVEADWHGSNHFDGWGSNTLGEWKSGYYRVDIFVAGKRIASKWFEVN